MTEAAIVDRRGTLPTRAGAEPYQRRKLSDIAYIVVHHTDVTPTRFTARQVAEYHVSAGAHLPFPSIAYQLYVEADGTVEQVADLEEVSWHAGQAGDDTIAGVSVKNWRGAAICFAGNEPTEAQIAGIREACRWIEEQTDKALPRYGHKDLSATECPGVTWEKWRHRI